MTRSHRAASISVHRVWTKRRIEGGVVDEHVDVAEALDDTRDEALHGRLVADVEDHSHHGCGTVLGGDRLDDLGAVDDVGHHHGRAFLREGAQRSGGRSPSRHR